MHYIDLHCDTIMQCYFDNKSLRENDLNIDLTRSKEAGLMAQCMAIFIPTNDSAAHYKVTQTPGDYFESCLAKYKRELSLNADLIAPALLPQDIERNFAEGKMSSILTVEDGVIIDGKLARLDELYGLGVRLITLTWNYENCIGFPQSPDPGLMALGLKPFGIEAIRRMNELGIIVDVSHLSEGGFHDVAKHVTKPFIASHSCCRTFCGATRNLTDSQLSILGDRGGVCGINFAPYFLVKDSMHTTIESIVSHMRHIRTKAGLEAVAFGSDFDGFSGEAEFGGCEGMPKIIEALSNFFSPRELEMICYKNALRVFKDNF
ncbi:MAG: membrane dipeptidase [Oscillospiraceae bacterium]|nr:membrane dipeptidase [Oscillospiraceae bacterium]